MSKSQAAVIMTITNARNLDELLTALREAVHALRHRTGPRLDEAVDLTSLPTYGGAEPSDTEGVWSWDAERLLVGDGSADWQIVERDEYYLFDE